MYGTGDRQLRLRANQEAGSRKDPSHGGGLQTLSVGDLISVEEGR